jgi:glucose uptake protein GlcU
MQKLYQFYALSKIERMRAMPVATATQYVRPA